MTSAYFGTHSFPRPHHIVEHGELVQTKQCLHLSQDLCKKMLETNSKVKLHVLNRMTGIFPAVSVVCVQLLILCPDLVFSV